ncbi:MAG: dihydroorotate dehydrogenase electron transfer subunit [Candidatus Riflebacteria bacterium]
MSDFMRTRKIKEIINHQPGIKSFRFDWPEKIEPGQFILAWLPGVDEKPFALSGVFGDEIEITIKAVGPFTRAMMETRPGQFIGLRGPFGKGFSVGEGQILIGGGIGNAPLRFHAHKLREAKIPFKWLIGVKAANDLAFRDELLSQPECIIFSEDGSIGQKGMITQGLNELAQSQTIKTVVAAGPEPMLLAVHRFARSQKSETAVQLSFERYMKCAVGLCGQCCLDGTGLRICVEGPVLTADQLEGVTELGLPHRSASGRRHS